jgi:hypothetical protein
MTSLCEKVFGKGFIKSIKHVHCALGYFVVNKHMGPSGVLIVSDKELNKVPKAFFWSYLYYIIYHNRSLEPFKDFEKRKVITDVNLARTVEPAYPRKKNITRKRLFNCINKLAVDHKLNLPVLKDVGVKTEATKAFLSTMPKGSQDIVITADTASFDGTLNNLTIPLDISISPAK